MTEQFPHQAQPTVPPTARRTAESLTAPDGSAVRLLLTEAHGATRCSMVEVSIPAGAVSRPVRHCTVEEVWYITAGRGRVWRCPPDLPAAEAAPVGVAAGDAIVIPTGWAFQFAPTAMTTAPVLRKPAPAGCALSALRCRPGPEWMRPKSCRRQVAAWAILRCRRPDRRGRPPADSYPCGWLPFAAGYPCRRTSMVSPSARATRRYWMPIFSIQ